MAKLLNKSVKVPELCRQVEDIAQEIASELPENYENLSPDATRQMLLDLRVHEIELEMQNEDLRRAQGELDATRARYFDLYDLAPVGYCTVSEAGLILEANFTASNLLGMSRGALGQVPIARFIHQDDQDIFYLHSKQLFATDEPQLCDLRMVKTDGTLLWMHLTSVVALDSDGKTVCHLVLNDITERKRLEEMAQAASLYARSLIEASLDPLVTISTEGKITDVNTATEQVTGVRRAHLIGSDFADYFTDPENARAGYQQVFSNGFVTDYPLAIRHVSGKITDVLYNASVYRDASGKVLGIFAAARDITERKRAEEALHAQKEFFHLITENIGDFIAVLDLEGRRLYNSPSYRQFFGQTRDLRGTDSFHEIHPEDKEHVKRVFRETVQTGIGRQIDYRLVMPDGRIRDMESRGSVIRDSEGRVAQVVVVSHDITERKQMEDKVRQMAFHDALTKLPNRRLLYDRLSQTMAASARSGCHAALMFLDLDNFKPLNDAHGHEVGDLLLIEVADRLKSCVREMDTVARFGGDEFVVMIRELTADRDESTIQAVTIAEKIRLMLSEPYRLGIKRAGKADAVIEHHCTASIGVALFNNHEASQDEILKWADTAMYQAKEAKRNTIRVTERNESISNGK